MTTTLPKPQRTPSLVLGSRCATGHADLATTRLPPRLRISTLSKKRISDDMQVWNLNQMPNHINMTGDVANFDDRVWVFFPKGPDTFVAHFLEAGPYQAALYHNAATGPLQCEPHLLHVRFAWAIISLLRAYLSKSTPRKFKVWVASSNDWQERIMDGQQLRCYVCPLRITNPTKKSLQLEDAGVKLDHLRTTNRHNYTRSVGTESTV